MGPGQPSVEAKVIGATYLADVVLDLGPGGDTGYSVDGGSALSFGPVMCGRLLVRLQFGEAAALRCRNIDLLRKRITVERPVTDVGGQLMRALPHQDGQDPWIPPLLAAELDGNMNRYESGPDELVFTTARGQQLRSTTFSRKHFRPAVEAADVPRPEDVRVHDLRQVSVTRSGPNRRRGGGLYRAPSQRVDLVFGKMSLTFRPRWTYRRMTGLGWARRGRLWRA